LLPIGVMIQGRNRLARMAIEQRRASCLVRMRVGPYFGFWIGNSRIKLRHLAQIMNKFGKFLSILLEGDA
jgi:hypothetical protein